MGSLFNRIWILLLTLLIASATVECRAASDDEEQRLAALELGKSSARTDAAVEPTAKTVETPTKSIEQLIAELGSDEFSVRRRAEASLLRIGSDAFDALMVATSSDDLETVTRARYILSRLRIDWFQPGDSKAVQQIMSSYGSLADAERRKRIARLATLENNQGLAALCRIARYDAKPLLAKYAAFQIICAEHPRTIRAASGIEIIAHSLGGSHRVPIQWIRNYVDQGRDVAAAVGRWENLIAAEGDLLEQDSEELHREIFVGLLQHQLLLCNDLSSNPPSEKEPAVQVVAMKALERLVDFQTGQFGQQHRGLYSVLDWIRNVKQWHVLALLEQRYATLLKKERSLLYLVAITRDAQGLQEEANEVAERAFQIIAEDNDLRLMIANLLISWGRMDWAEREFRYVIDAFPIPSEESGTARSGLANWCLHDRREDKEAAQLLTDFLDAFDRKQKEKPKEKLKADSRRNAIVARWAQGLKARREFYLACHAQSQGDYVQQRKFLESAIKYDKDDVDVLIAMYRLQGADEEFHKQTVDRIQRTSSHFLGQIEAAPDISFYYNAWAWLICNTEGDFLKAIEFSHHSLELSPNDAGSLDTLGRCYYAVGDFTNAVKYQRQAVKASPQLQVMQRQLKQFEKEWAEKEKAQAENKDT